MVMFVGILLLIGSVILGILFARTGTKPKDMTTKCRYCGTVIPYEEFHKQACPNCRRSVNLSDAELNRKQLQKPSTRFLIGFLVGVIVSFFILGKLFGGEVLTQALL